MRKRVVVELAGWGLALLLWALVLPTRAAAAGGLLVVSQQSGQILEYDEADGSFLRVLVEEVQEGFQFPGGIALRPGTGELYVTSTFSGEIWVYDAATAAALPPPVESGLIGPGPAVFDASGAALYFLAAESDLSTSTDAVQKWEAGSGIVSTLGSDSAATFAGIALSGSSLLVSDSVGGTVQEFPIAGGNGSTRISGLSGPTGILLPSASEMWIAEAHLDRVVEYDWNGSAWVFDRVLLPAGHVDGPSDLATAPDGRLTVSGSLSDDVVLVDPTTLAVSPLVAPGSGGLTSPGALAWSGSTLLVASRASNSVVYYDAAGTPTGDVARGISAAVDAGLVFAPGDTLLVGSMVDNDLIEFDAQGGAQLRTLFDACPTIGAPYEVAVDAAGGIYLSCAPSGGVRRFDEQLEIFEAFVSQGSGGLASPRALVFGPNGNLFVSSSSGEVLEFDGSSGAFVAAFVDATGNGGGAVDPYGLVFHQGALYVASFFTDEVVEFDAATGAHLQRFVSAGSGGLDAPSSLAFGPDGSLYVTSQGDDSVKRYDGSTGSFLDSFVAPGSGGLDLPFDLAFRPQPAPVPVLSAAARVALALGLVLAGARRAGPRTGARR